MFINIICDIYLTRIYVKNQNNKIGVRYVLIIHNINIYIIIWS